jgi:5-methylcytosine-specific restriction endonuclease McrA
MPERNIAPLLDPDDPDLKRLLPGSEVREAYRFLFGRRTNPPTMIDWREESQRIFGKANAQTDRRLRDVRPAFFVDTEQRGRDHHYVLVGRNADYVPGSDAPINGKLEAQVYEEHGRFCAMCGLGPKDGVKLQIDHRVPRSWGGLTEVSNLEPLCTRHNHGKKAYIESLDPYADAIRASIGLPTPWERIGELLRQFASAGQPVPSSLLPVVGRETHKGDPARRLRDLRVVLGWDIKAEKKKVDGVTDVAYRLVAARPWPPEGPHEAIKAYERDRKRRKRERDALPS